MSEIYRGNPGLIHIADGQRASVGRLLANQLDYNIRSRAIDEAEGYAAIADILNNPLCPGCYMVAVFNCAIELAKRNGQSLTELGNSLGNAFKALAQDGAHAESIESIEVQLDSEPCPTGEPQP